ncbi:RagB/SusD family nutrient uptake outer membrane protein [Pedobacter heparinus]|uniref:RagB/SusD family nutrient uptake outer membrane protein n=1 Tax=Pedobacter heparinus TaxID=984 RepID=UPI00292DAF69|nr:RagB/SusD family nutrient uptake outer membrane protein [Pedobacter heparinus]
MNTYKFIFFSALTISIMICGCGKELNVSPQNAIPEGSLGVNDIAQLRTGMYSRMEDVAFSFYFDFDRRGENLQAGPAVPALIDPVGLTPTDADVATLWQNAYNGISTINFLIESADNLGNNATAATKSYKGEALYFRALMYYYLVTRWGGVPILLKNTNEAVQRSTEAAVWAQIKADLRASRSLVGPFTNNFYVSDQAVKALIAKVSLATNDLTAAALYADSVINFSSNRFALATDATSYSSIFVSGSTSKETIFALANNSPANTHILYGFTNDTKASWTFSPTDFIYNNLFSDQTSPVIKTDDKRKTATFIADKTRIIKYSNGRAGQQLAVSANPNAAPIVLSRLAEMYLIKAEAQGAANGAATLTPYFASRYAMSPSQASVAALNPTQYQNLVLNENRREFYTEGHWWYDIKRTGRTDLLTTLAGRNHLLYYPIPQVQRDLAGYTQNPIY